MARLRELSIRVDMAVKQNPQSTAIGDPEALAAADSREGVFAEQRARGATPFRAETGRPAGGMESFGPAPADVVVFLHVAGG